MSEELNPQAMSNVCLILYAISIFALGWILGQTHKN